MTEGRCEYCSGSGPERVSTGEGVEKPVYVCATCWKMMKDPRKAIPLMRGNTALNLRGKMSEEDFKKMAEAFFLEVSKWKPRN